MTTRARSGDPWPDLPSGWRVSNAWGPPLFTTHARLERPDGSEVEWSSRAHRKGLTLRPAAGRDVRGSRWQLRRATASSWWIGSLFVTGSLCFALGSLPLLAADVDADVVAAVFFVGSIFFTTAAYLQYHETVNAPRTLDLEEPGRRGLRRALGWAPHRIDWWAASIQLTGTIYFNVTTFAATRQDLTLAQEKHLIWAPDVWGSVCFLAASALAYSEVCPRLWRRPQPTIAWWICALNLGGSVAFGAAAVASRYLPTTGEPANIALVNLGTFVGAICFLVGAALLPVESAKASAGR